MNATITRYLRQPTTIAALAVAVGGAVGVAVYAATKDVAYAKAAGISAVAIVLGAVPDNSASKSSVEKLVNDVVVSVATKHLTPSIVADVAHVFEVAAAAPVAPKPVA